MATARARHGCYIFQRPSSSNWYVKLRSPGGNRTEKSLRTSDKLEAEVRAAPMIEAHKAKLLAARPRLEMIWQHTLEPGREHVGPDGSKILATDKDLFYIGHNGAISRTEPNGGQAFVLSSVPRLGLTVPAAIEVTDRVRPTLAVKNGDDALIETYIKHRNVTGYDAGELRGVWALYQQLTNGKALKDASRDDGRKLVAHFEGQGLKSATIQKKIGRLTAAVNLAIDEGKLKFNPFSSVVPKRNDKQTRLPLSEADIKATKARLNGLPKGRALLFRLLASTGMRLSEAFEIDSELQERGCRYVIVGNKTDQSRRRVPLPAGLLPYLPKVIKAQLFQGGAPAASRALGRFLNECGIDDPRKVVHSLRHRAQDRLRAAGCPEDIRWAILGHEEKTVAAGYGEGFPVPLLKQWIDKIGF